MKRNRREQGQVIYLLAVGIITLLGFTALAVDGARLFSERRNAQGVADTAAFTAASYLGQYTVDYIDDHWNPYGTSSVDQLAESAALERIRSNGYDTSEYNPWGSNDRLRISISRQTEGPLGAVGYLVDVFLISEIDPIFAQVIYNGPMLVNVESQAIVRPQTNLAFGQAMYSLSEDECNALTFSGNSDVFIIGSGIYANSTCEPNAINFSGTADMDVSGNITTPGAIDVDGDSVYNSGGDVEGTDQQAFPDVPAPDCSGQPDGYYVTDAATSTTVFYPGKWYSNIQITCGTCTQIFMPGLYCLSRNFTVTNGNITGHNVTFYLDDGSFTVNGGVLDLTAPENGEADDGTNSWDGMLFYLGEGSWSVSGAAGTYLEGTVYAPGPPDPTCKLTGSGLTDGYNLQLVCNTISLIGGAGLNIDYTGENAYSPPVSIDLVE